MSRKIMGDYLEKRLHEAFPVADGYKVERDPQDHGLSITKGDKIVGPWHWQYGRFALPAKAEEQPVETAAEAVMKTRRLFSTSDVSPTSPSEPSASAGTSRKPDVT